MPKKKETTMVDRTLADCAIDIKGKKYVEVAHRVRYFIDNYPGGSIETHIENLTDKGVLIKAVITTGRDPDQVFSGHAYERFDQGMINKTSCIENCETSAVGRALGFMDIGVIDGIASADEVNRAIRQQSAPSIPTPVAKPKPVAAPSPAPAAKPSLLEQAQANLQEGPGGHPAGGTFTATWKGKTIGDVPGFTEYMAKNVQTVADLDKIYNEFTTAFKLSEKQSAWVEKTYSTRYEQLASQEMDEMPDEEEAPF